MRKVIITAIERAIEESAKSDVVSARVGAAIIKGNKITVVKHNKLDYGSRIIQKYGGNVRSIHAEMNAILYALKRGDNLEGAEIVVASKRSDGTFRNSKPCKYCMALIRESGIKHVWYVDDGYITRINIKE